MLADWNRAGERNLSHVVLGDEVFGDRRGNAEDEIEHASRQAGVGEAANHFDASAGRLLGGFEDQRAAGGERAADLARGRQRREIPRRKRGDDADRLLHNDLPYLAAARHDAAVSAAAFFGVPFDDVGRGHHLRTRFRVGLTFFQGEDLADRVVALAHQISGFAHDLGAVVSSGCPPRGKALFGGFERVIEIGDAGVRQMRERLLGGRIDDVFAGTAVAIEPLAVDKQLKIGVHETLCRRLDVARFAGAGRRRRLAGLRGRVHPQRGPAVCRQNENPGARPGQTDQTRDPGFRAARILWSTSGMSCRSASFARPASRRSA